MTNTKTISLGILSLGMFPACGSTGTSGLFANRMLDDAGGTTQDARGGGAIGPPVQVARGPASLVALTSDGYAVYRASDQTLRAVALQGNAPSLPITDQP